MPLPTLVIKLFIYQTSKWAVAHYNIFPSDVEHIYVHILHSHIFFEEMFIQVICTYLHGIVWFDC